MKLIASSCVIISLLSSFQCCSRNAADVIFYHYRSSLQESNIKHYPLFPLEGNIEHFPTPLSKNETDLSLLQKYYKDISQAYETHLTIKIIPKINEYKRKMSKQDQHIQIEQVRRPSGKNQLSQPLRNRDSIFKGQNIIGQKARTQAISYYRTTFKTLSDNAESLREKADFYKDLAKTSKDLYRGDIH